MLHAMKKISLLAVLMLLFGAAATPAQNVVIQGDDDPYYYSDRPRIDRFLSAEVWTDHSDAEYYVGDNISIYFRTNRDAFVAIYSIDSRGMVNLLFPSGPGMDNYVRGGVTYTLPSPDDNYDLVLNGPQGSENIQIVASREQFPIPDWYRNSGLVCDWDSRDDYMDYLNGRYFVRYDGQRFAYDRAVVFVDEWEPDYFRPVYYPYYPSWSVTGNVYVDYPWGSSVYINGYYWGCTPLYIPRILVGWHTITVYDPWGYCWEDDFHVSRYNTVIFNKTIIRTTPSIRSKYKEVRTVGYRDPVKAGYPDFFQKVAEKKAVRLSSSGSGKAVVNGSVAKTARNALTKQEYETFTPPAKKYVRGESKLVKGDRGYETRGVMLDKSGKSSSAGESSRTLSTGKSRGTTTTYGTDENRTVGRSGKSVTSSGSSDRTYRKSNTGQSSTETRSYYQKKSGSTSKQSRSSSTVQQRSTTKKSTPTYNKPSQPKSSGKSSRSSTPSYQAPKKSSSGGSSSSAKSRPSSTGSSKSSSGKSSSSNSSSSKKRSK